MEKQLEKEEFSYEEFEKEAIKGLYAKKSFMGENGVWLRRFSISYAERCFGADNKVRSSQPATSGVLLECNLSPSWQLHKP